MVTPTLVRAGDPCNLAQVEELFALDTVDDLRGWILAHESEWMRDALLTEFARLRNYRNAAEWNRLVRVCEALALIGWGDSTPVEANADRWINGSMYTKLMTASFRHDRERGWIVRQGLLVLDEAEPSMAGARERLDSQRVLLPKNPLRLNRSGNLQHGAVPFADQAKRLRGLLDERLARSYGDGFDFLGITLAFSYSDAGLGRAQEYFHDEADVVERDGVRSFVRPRLDVGRISRRGGQTVLMVTRHYTAEEGAMPLRDQCEGLVGDLHEIVDLTAAKLRRKAPDFRFDALRADLDATLALWMENVKAVTDPADEQRIPSRVSDLPGLLNTLTA